jgi:hypothetical protein
MTRDELQQATGLDAEVLDETLRALRGPDAPDDSHIASRGGQSCARHCVAYEVPSTPARSSTVSPALSPDEVRKDLRARLADGRLFGTVGVSTVRQGTGRPCNV